MGILEILRSRDLVAQSNHEDELGEHIASKPRTVYMGFDPTGESLHVGHLLGAMNLRRWQVAGHKVVVLMGGATAAVGDPSGKTDMRKMMDDDEISSNIECIKAQMRCFIELNDPAKGVIVNNAEWLMQLNYMEFMREYGRHFSVNRMVKADCFKSRMEKKGLTFLEFNYMILQSYDFLELHRTMGVTVQLGGDDQWSNMLSGGELVRKVSREKSFCMTHPLLTTSAGKKMGKTEGGAIWLDSNKTSPFDFFQYWRNTEDRDIRKVFMYLTDIPVAEVEELCAVEGRAINESKVRLAYEITRLVHGSEAADDAKSAASALFSSCALGSKAGSGSEPEVTLTAGEFGDEMAILDILTITKILASKAEARRLIQQGGLALNGKKVDDVKYVLGREDVMTDAGCLIKKGKKHYYRLRISK